MEVVIKSQFEVGDIVVPHKLSRLCGFPCEVLKVGRSSKVGKFQYYVVGKGGWHEWYWEDEIDRY